MAKVVQRTSPKQTRHRWRNKRSPLPIPHVYQYLGPEHKLKVYAFGCSQARQVDLNDRSSTRGTSRSINRVSSGLRYMIDDTVHIIHNTV